MIYLKTKQFFWTPHTFDTSQLPQPKGTLNLIHPSDNKKQNYISIQPDKVEIGVYGLTDFTMEEFLEFLEQKRILEIPQNDLLPPERLISNPANTFAK